MQELKINVGEETLVFHGTGRLPPIRGCLRRPVLESSGGHVREQLDLILEGSRADTQAFLHHLQSLLTQLEAGINGSLLISPAVGEAEYQSRLFRGELTWLVGSVQPHGLGLRLELEREDFWSLPWQILPLSNTYGTQQTQPLRIINRADGLGENHVIFTAQTAADCLSPLRIKLVNEEEGWPLSLIYAGLSDRETPLFNLEGETAQADPANGIILDAACSNGAYVLAPLNPQARALLVWEVPAEDWSTLAGKWVFPLVRLRDLPAEDLWLWWKVFYGGLTFESAQQTAGDGLLFPLPRLFFPKAAEGIQPEGALTVELWGQLTQSEENTLSLDVVQLLGTEGWLVCEAALNSGEVLLIEPQEKQAVLLNESGTSRGRSLRVEGDGMNLLPRQAGCLTFAFAAEDACPLTASLSVQLWVQPRIRVLP